MLLEDKIIAENSVLDSEFIEKNYRPLTKHQQTVTRTRVCIRDITDVFDNPNGYQTLEEQLDEFLSTVKKLTKKKVIDLWNHKWKVNHYYLHSEEEYLAVYANVSRKETRSEVINRLLIELRKRVYEKKTIQLSEKAERELYERLKEKYDEK